MASYATNAESWRERATRARVNVWRASESWNAVRRSSSISGTNVLACLRAAVRLSVAVRPRRQKMNALEVERDDCGREDEHWCTPLAVRNGSTWDARLR
jgi:hypothetical protein